MAARCAEVHLEVCEYASCSIPDDPVAVDADRTRLAAMQEKPRMSSLVMWVGSARLRVCKAGILSGVGVRSTGARFWRGHWADIAGEVRRGVAEG